MNINVTATKVTIDKGTIVNKGEYNIRECIFTLSEEYNGLVCKALFTIEKTNTTYEQSIVNNKCTIPYEVTVQKGAITLGVIGYEIEDDELIKRYSPLPYHFTIEDGSYIEDIENQSTPTPSELEQLEQRVSQVEIDAEQVEINKQDISDIKQEQITQNNDILLRSLITETGSQIELSLNTTNFKMTATLKDKNGTVVNTSNEIDLPLESVVVNASYDSSTKEIVLTLQNGNTVRFSVADLVSGLVSDTDYATASKGGVVKTASNYALNTSSNGTLQSMTKTYTDYLSGYNVMFVSKGTLENVITGKQLVNQTQLNTKADKSSLVTGSGENITLQNTAELEFIQPPLPRGNSEQVQYSGKNKFNPVLLSQEENYNTYNSTTKLWTTTSTSNYTRSILYRVAGNSTNRDINKLIKLKANTTYTIKMFDFVNNTETTTSYINYGFYDNTGTYINGMGGTEIATFTTESECWLDIRRTASSGSFTFSNIQLEQGSTATAYEPYVGGTESPNPQFPSNISNVTGDAEVLVQNKNLFDINKVTSQYITDRGANYITSSFPSSYKDGGNISIPLYNKNYKFSGNCTAGRFELSLFLNGEKIGNTQTSTTGFTINNTQGLYDTAQIILSNGTSTGSITFSNMQLELGSTATTYTPHQEQTFTFPLGTQRMFLGDYLADDGIHHVRKQVVFNGTENWSLFDIGSGKLQYSLSISDLEHSTTNKNTISNAFKSALMSDRTAQANNHIIYSISSGIAVRCDEYANATDFKAYLVQQYANNTPVYAEYVLKQEEITPYTTEQQQAYDEIKQAISYEEQTNISGTSDESNPLFEVQAVQYKEPDYWTIAYVNTMINKALQELS